MTKPRPIPPAIAAIAPDGNLTVAQKRRLILDLALKRVKPGSGSALEFMRRRTAMKVWPDLRPILTDIPWVVVGGVATRAYMPERETKDLDILVHQDDGEAAVQILQNAGYSVITPLAVPGYLLLSPERIKINIFFGTYLWLRQALAKPNRDAAGLPVLDLPYLVLMKSQADRVQGWGDVIRMLGLASPDQLPQTRQVVKRYAPDIVDDLETMIYLGELEVQPPSWSPGDALGD